MCGIAGFINFPNGFELAEKANIIQKHRGPDSQNIWSDGDVVFAHQRLSIIDLCEIANQPFVKGKFVIIYNGEVYNYKELRTKYLIDIDFKSNSDTEVVLELFIKYGPDSFAMLEGMFAFAIYDLATKISYIVRDCFGIKPLFFLGQDNRFSFASELKTLVKLVPFEKTINRVSLVGGLNYLWIPGHETIFSEVYKLEPGCFLIVNSDGVYSKQRYWDLTESKNMVINEKSAVIELTKVLENSMKRHMVADVEIGSFLSGGIDSSLLSVMTKNDKLNTYTIATNNRDKKIERMPDDEKYARDIAELHGFNHTEIIGNSDIIDLLPKMVKSLDEPIGDPAAINTFIICSEAKKKGIKVLLSGMGADEILFGYRRQKALIMSMRYRKISKYLRFVIEGLVSYLPVRICKRGLRFSRWSKKFVSFSSGPRDDGYRQSFSYYTENELKNLLKDDFSKEIKTVYQYHNTIFNSKSVLSRCN